MTNDLCWSDTLFRLEGTASLSVFDGSALVEYRLEQFSRQIGGLARRLGERVEPGRVVGIIHQCGINLVIAWTACLVAGCKPVILQYPTSKQDLLTYRTSVRYACAAAGIGTVLLSEQAAAVVSTDWPALPILVLGAALPDDGPAIAAVPHGTIIQMSSGTTGHRKPMELSTRAIAQHVRRYNEVLRLDSSDSVISWLPLYHDMGFIACFCMPLVLGIPIVMMDPVTWVGDPGSLFRLIEATGATICYMPNFGFEVMTRHAGPSLSSMRRWISCSEPVSASTVERFLVATGTAPDHFAACYGMAENVFAVTLSEGFRPRLHEGQRLVSCGRPIPGTDVKVVDGELCIRSPESILAYADGSSIVDEEGFYRSGDMGAIVDGEVLVFGRVHDVINQAGEKFFLSDIDLVANEVISDARGRLAAVIDEQGLGTETPVLLVEANDFFERAIEPAVVETIHKRTGLQNLKISFVPPRFITKTTSGKANRRVTARNLAALSSGMRGGKVGEDDGELLRLIQGQPSEGRIAECLDSLSHIILRMLLEERGLAFDAGETIGALRTRLSALREADPASRSNVPLSSTFNIVSLCEQEGFLWLNDKYMDSLEAVVGVPVRFIHLVLPPAAVTLSDLVFADYLLPREAAEVRCRYAHVEQHLDILRNASLILVDDRNEIELFDKNLSFSFLSHRFERDPRADLIAVRQQRYATQHHQLPLGVVPGTEFLAGGRDGIDRSITALGRYLRTPVIRIASIPKYRPFTRNWEVHIDNKIFSEDISTENHHRVYHFSVALWAAIKERSSACELKPAPYKERIRQAEMPHFCSFYLNKSHIDRILDTFESFIICGAEASAPYIRRRLDEMGKRWVTLPTHHHVSADIRRSYACVINVGPMGEPPVEIPYVNAICLMPTPTAMAYGNVPTSLLERIQDIPCVGHDLSAHLDGGSDGLYRP